MAEKNVRSGRARKSGVNDRQPASTGISNHPAGEEKEEQQQIPPRGHSRE